jgi:hypothetical protein
VQAGVRSLKIDVLNVANFDAGIIAQRVTQATSSGSERYAEHRRRRVETPERLGLAVRRAPAAHE